MLFLANCLVFRLIMFHVGYRLGMDAERFANKRWARQSVFLFCDANFQKVGARITLTDTPIASPQDFPKSFMLIIVY